MNPGVERFLILGCIAILILEAPSLLKDLRFGDGSYAVLAAEPAATAVVVEPVEPTPVPALVVESLVAPIREPDAIVFANVTPEQPGM